MLARINKKTYKRPRVPTTAKIKAQKVYNTPRWTKLRNWYIRNHPFCEDCLEKDPVKTTIAQEVHHKTPWATGSTPAEQEDLAYDSDNLKALCVECHKIADRKFINH